MQINSKPLWLKIGLIFLAIDTFIEFFLFIIAFISKDFEALGFSLLFTQLPAVIIFKPLIFGGALVEIILMSIFGLIGYFIIGALIGWIITLITSNRKDSNLKDLKIRSVIKKGLLIGGLIGGLFGLIFSFIKTQIFMNSQQYFMNESYRTFVDIFFTVLGNSVIYFLLAGLIFGAIVGRIISNNIN